MQFLLLAAVVAEESSVQRLEARVAKHGYGLPMPAGSAWDDYKYLALAVNAIYAYVPSTESPPPVVPAGNGNPGFKCTTERCTLSASWEDNEGAVWDGINEIIGSYTGKNPGIQHNAAIPPSTFSSMGAKSRACSADTDCNADLTCCDKDPENIFPGICCSTAKLNRYDAEVPDWVWIFFLSGAGLLLVGWTVQSFHLLDTFF
tara:strand:+ start:85 stop:693 length:609 start_codon:yes stop_codon:yes gene_type:complete